VGRSEVPLIEPKRPPRGPVAVLRCAALFLYALYLGGVAAPRAEVSALLAITPAGPCRRQPFAAELIADDRPSGQVAEVLLTVGGEAF